MPTTIFPSFNSFLSEAAAADVNRGYGLEYALVQLHNGEPLTVKDPDVKAAAESALKKMALPKTVKIEHFGDVEAPVTAFWKSFYPDGKEGTSSRIPKTDVKAGPARISVKYGKNSQLMSGGPSEAAAVCFAAAQAAGVQKKVAEAIRTRMGEMARSAKTYTNIATALKEGKDAILNHYNEVNKEVMELVRKEFTSNPQFQIEWIREALTGKAKFGASSPACANKLLATNETGSVVVYDPTASDMLCKKLASRAALEVRMKTDSVKIRSGGKVVGKTGEYIYRAVVGMNIDEFEKGFPVNEELLTESWLSDLWHRVLEWMSDVWTRITTWLAQSWENVMEFFEWDVNSVEVSFNNDISFV